MKWSSPRPLSLAVAGVVVAITIALSWMTSTVASHNNDRLLEQQVRQVAASLAGQVPVVQSELSDVAVVAAATNGDQSAFQNFSSEHLAPNGSFSSISLWRLNDGNAVQLAVNGGSPTIVASGEAKSFFSHVTPSAQLYVTSLLPGANPALGFAAMPVGQSGALAVYAEITLPKDKRLSLSSSSPYSDLDFAVYLGATQDESQLLEATALPIHGHTAVVTLPFGDTKITLVGAASGSLSGGLTAALPWIVLGVGLALALATGSAVEYVSWRRAHAEALARENERLYVQQRGIAVELQRALLPDVPHVDGLDIAARYLAGVAGTEVGGDWYDVISTRPGHCVVVVGDVSGRGLHAATTMAGLRNAIRAYVVDGNDVAAVLTKLTGVLSFETDHRFATVLAAEIDVERRRVTIASAGHFLPLLVTVEGADFLQAPVEPPVGIEPLSPSAVSFDVPEKAMLLAFTDGLVERKGEDIDAGLDRLRRACATYADSLDEFVDGVVSGLGANDADDDVVLLALRWSS